MNDLLNVEDSDESEEQDTPYVVTLESIPSAETVIASLKHAYVCNQVATASDSETESEEDNIDGDDLNDPDYVPVLNESTDTSVLVDDQQCSTSTPLSIAEKENSHPSPAASTQSSFSTPTLPSSVTAAQPSFATLTQSTPTQSSSTSATQSSSATATQSSSATTQPLNTTFLAGTRQSIPSAGKRRRTNPALWKKNVKKAKVNKGEEYQTLKGNSKNRSTVQVSAKMF